MKKERTWFAKLAIFFFVSFILLAVVLSFFKGTPPYTISDSMVFALGLIVILFISDSIETFSLGNLITLKKKVQDKEKEVSKLATENHELRSQISMIISTSINSQNSNSTFIGLGETFEKIFKVEPATEDDTKKEKAIEQDSIEALPASDPPTSTRLSSDIRRRFFMKTEEYVIKKFVQQRNMDLSNVQRDVKFSEQFLGCDPIMDRLVVFDAYIKRPLDELFIETQVGQTSPTHDFRLYYMISKIYHYAKVNKISAKLLLIVPKYSQEFFDKHLSGMTLIRSQGQNILRLKEIYAPAIKNDLMEIVELELSDDECRSLLQEVTQPKS